MKTALLLSTAFITTSLDHPSRGQRISQYVNGFGQIADLTKKYGQFEVFSVDNTVAPGQVLEPVLIQALHNIPTFKASFHFWDNRWGKVNKGSGLVVQWRKALPEIVKAYDYVIHYEPRQDLTDFSFFEKFLTEPAAYFYVTNDRVKKFKLFPFDLVQVLTGILSMKAEYLLAYANSADPEKMARRKINVECDLYKYITANRLPFVPVKRLGMRWHNQDSGDWITY